MLALAFLPTGVAELFSEAFDFLYQSAPYWLPVVLLLLFLNTWKNYVQAYYISNLDWTYLEVKLPRTIEKPVSAMEVVLSKFYEPFDGTLYERWWKGKVRQWFSLELISIEGNIHFVIAVQRDFSRFIRNYIYSQYPEAEIHSVDDYAKHLNYAPPDGDWDLYGTEFRLEEKDAYPIKTYVDYELEKTSVDEEQKVDPITPVLEFLSTMGPGEQVWIQVLTRAAKKKRKSLFSPLVSWKDEGKELVKELRKPEKEPPPDAPYAAAIQRFLTPGETELLKSIERNISKFGYDIGIRIVYIAKKDVFDKKNVPGLLGAFQQLNTEDRNSFKPKNNTDFKHPWEDIFGVRVAKKKRSMLAAYKARSYFYPPYDRKPFVLSAEELATVYHFPGQVASTPTMQRIQSRTSEPPRDLPT